MATKKKHDELGPPDGSKPEDPSPEDLRPWYEVEENPEKMA